MAIRALGGIAVSKLFATFMGTSGITLLSHFQNLMALFTQLPIESVNRSLMKFWSDPKLEDRAKLKLFHTGFWVVNLLVLLSFLVVYFNQDYFLRRLVASYSVGQFMAIFVPGILMMLFTGLLNSIILAKRFVKGFAFVSVSGTILLVICVFLAVYYGNMDQALLSIVVGYGLMIISALIFAYRSGILKTLSLGGPHKDSLKKISSFILMAIGAIVVGKLLDFFVRDYIIEHYGADRTGLWQGVVKMSNNFLMVFSGTVGVIYYPKMASLIHDHKALRSYTLKIMGFVTFVTLICLGIYYFNRDFILTLFFSSGFERASYLVRHQAVGDFFAILSYLLAYLLSARVKTAQYIGAQLVSAAIYLGVISLLLDTHNLEALAIAYKWRFIGFFAILVIFNRRLLFK